MKKLLREIMILTTMGVLLSGAAALAQTPISGALTGSLGPDTYLVEGDCEIPSGETLTIQPGTTFLFSGHYFMFIYGTLIASGTESDSIVFTREIPTQSCRWGGLRFMSGAPSNSFVSYCLIDNCLNELYPYFYGGGIHSDGVDLIVTNTTIQNCQATDGGGFYGTTSAHVEFNDCVIANNEASNGGGLYYQYGTSGEINGCTVIKNNSTGT